MLNFIPVGRLVVTSESDLPLDYGVEAINRNAIMGEQGVQKRAQHAALWYTGVYRRVEEDRLSDLTDMDPGVQSYSQNGISTFVLDISTLFSKCKIK